MNTPLNPFAPDRVLPQDRAGAFSERRAELAEAMYGFSDLITPVQGAMVGISLDTGEIWDTPDYATTRVVVRAELGDLYNLIEGWGVER